jgi:hypothetical protein
MYLAEKKMKRVQNSCRGERTGQSKDCSFGANFSKTPEWSNCLPYSAPYSQAHRYHLLKPIGEKIAMVEGAVPYMLVAEEKNGDKFHLQPNYDQIPETNHAQLERCVSGPCPRILDCDNVHEMEDQLHCQ